MNRRTLALIGLMFGTLAATNARAAECPGNPNALGTSRVLEIDPQDYPRIGTVQYAKSLPLQDKEVVLTFDDGPMPPYTNRVLEVLADHGVKANYFIIGRMARGYPELLRQARAAGHVIGTHSQNHPLAFEHMPIEAVKAEVEQGIVSVGAALGEPDAVAPFFRIPGLLRNKQVEAYLQSRGLTAWSADVVADDWKHITASEVVRRAMSRLDAAGKGILLLHDIQPATALALPELLRQLHKRGYRIVQVVPTRHIAPARQDVPVAARTAPPVAIATASSPRELPEGFRPKATWPVSAAAMAAAPAASAPEPGPEIQFSETARRAIAYARTNAPSPAEPMAEPPEPARGNVSIPREPVRPYASMLKPAENFVSAVKLGALEPREGETPGVPPRQQR